MATKTVQDSSLTAIANAIRTKGGTSAQLEFSNEFVSAIQNIPTGTTPTGTKQVSIVQNGTVTEDVTNYASAEITTNVPQIKRGVLRPDAELVESWGYDKLWIEDEHGTLPAYSTSAVTLKASEALTVNHQWNLDDYKYIVLVRCLVIPIYNVSTIARGRVEWSASNGAYELVSIDANTIPSLLEPDKFISSRNLAWVSSGGAVYRMPYYANSLGQFSMYSATSYGIWCSLVAPSYGSGQLGINSPSLILRCQPNVFDQPFYEALDDIRFQWKIELWREPIGSLNYDGWTAYQEFEHIVDCLDSPTHKLT